LTLTRDNLLDVIQDDQQFLAPQQAAEDRADRRRPLGSDIHGRGNGGHDELGTPDFGQGDEDNAVAELFLHRGRYLYGQASLPHARRAGQVDQPILTSQQGSQLVELALASEKGGQGPGEDARAISPHRLMISTRWPEDDEVWDL